MYFIFWNVLCIQFGAFFSLEPSRLLLSFFFKFVYFYTNVQHNTKSQKSIVNIFTIKGTSYLNEILTLSQISILYSNTKSIEQGDIQIFYMYITPTQIQASVARKVSDQFILDFQNIKRKYAIYALALEKRVNLVYHIFIFI